MTHNMQSVIMALQQFWAERGCLIWQPYYTQVGAGTMNPATFLRVLGPEPWRVAYVEPSVRPDDARYGENPNRMQQHFQFQVILKPDPGDAQDLYLQSLMSIGIDPMKHDLRFVEDKWEAPALGAWGLGWEVWLDGQEITQFTYFQQAGGETLDPVSVEITYGLERILIGVLGLDHFKDIPWNDRLRYGDVLLQAEAEQSAYYLRDADIGRMSAVFALHDEEAQSALKQGLVLPAYDNLLRCSHVFNVLDARGAVGVTERAALFGRMRDLSRAISQKYIEQRRALGFPWMGATPSTSVPSGEDWQEDGPSPTRAEDFVLEIGTEEMPTADVSAALEAIPGELGHLLDDVNLSHGAIEAFGTPRRLVAVIHNLHPSADEVVQEIKGPPYASSFDETGRPTREAMGWARKYNLDEAGLAQYRMVDAGREYLGMVRKVPGGSADHFLSGLVLPELLRRLRFDQMMRWIGRPGDSPDAVALRRTAFARPIRWLVALHGDHVVPFEYARLRAGRATRSRRFFQPETSQVAGAANYSGHLAAHGVMVDPAERRRLILEQARALAGEVGGEIEADEALVAEIVQLVEAPQALRGSFDPSFLSLPAAVLAAVMKKHQRYLPVRDRQGGLLPYFVAVRNGGTEGMDLVRAGNEHVLRARFADADFFLRKDREHPLEHFRMLLARLTFQTQLGSYLDKTQRIENLTLAIAEDLHLTKEDWDTARRAASLCKFDLATALVAEMTSLQGVLGRIYALERGETEAVALAIHEHYLPRFAGDDLPESMAGIAVGLADRLDSLSGLFAAGVQPSGARDPYALRRTAVGLIQILVTRALRVDLRRWLDFAVLRVPLPRGEETREACLEFIAARQEALLLAEGHRYDVVAAVLGAQAADPAGAAKTVAELESAVGDSGWPVVLQAYARCARIVRGQKVDGRVDPGLFVIDAERNLLAGIENVGRPVESAGDLVASLQALVPPITEFFDRVLVMDADKALRANRLALVKRVVDLADGIADLSRLEGF